jgi:hypothetical protein
MALLEYIGMPVIRYWPSREDDELLKSELIESHDGTKQYRFCPFRRSIIETSQVYRKIDKQELSQNSNLPKSFIDMLEAIENNPKIPSMLLGIHQAYPEFTTYWRSKVKGLLPGKIDFLRYLVSEVVSKTYAISTLTNEILEDFLKWLDIKKCPSFYCYLRIKDEINKDKLSKPLPSEMVDLIHITALPYYDAFSTDKRMWDYIRRCGIKKNLFETGYTREMRAFKTLPDAIKWLESHNDS